MHAHASVKCIYMYRVIYKQRSDFCWLEANELLFAFVGLLG